jgi:hypothetical protein
MASPSPCIIVGKSSVVSADTQLVFRTDRLPSRRLCHSCPFAMLAMCEERRLQPGKIAFQTHRRGWSSLSRITFSWFANSFRDHFVFESACRKGPSSRYGDMPPNDLGRARRRRLIGNIAFMPTSHARSFGSPTMSFQARSRSRPRTSIAL